MGSSNKYFGFYLFIFFSSALCTIYSLFFHPITYEAQGDFPSYLDLAKQIYGLPGATTADLSHRSPLYSVILGLFIMIFGESQYLVWLMGFQYFLIFFSSVLIYKLIFQLTDNQTAAFTASIAGIINLTTVFFGFMILSETLALFLFTVTAWLLMKYYRGRGAGIIVMTGLVLGMLILARYNLIGLPLVIVCLLVVVFVFEVQKTRLNKKLLDISLFVFSILFILNIWAFRNYLTSGRYELIPKHHGGQRWAVPATINPDNNVSNEYREVLGIFLKTREELLIKEQNREYRKSSLLEYGVIKRINDYFRSDVSGYLLYKDSEEELLCHYNLEKNTDGIRALNDKLKPFYDEIAAQNKREIRRLRTYSFLYSFKHISPTLPGKEPVNLNMLPSSILKAYKVLFILIVVLTYIGSIVHTARILLKKDNSRNGLEWILLYGIIWYFPVVNWYANVLGDANRFRYPADMLIIALFVALSFRFYRRILRPNKINEKRQAAA
jgi:hypothetical protein